MTELRDTNLTPLRSTNTNNNNNNNYTNNNSSFSRESKEFPKLSHRLLQPLSNNNNSNATNPQAPSTNLGIHPLTPSAQQRNLLSQQQGFSTFCSSLTNNCDTVDSTTPPPLPPSSSTALSSPSTSNSITTNLLLHASELSAAVNSLNASGSDLQHAGLAGGGHEKKTPNSIRGKFIHCFSF